MHNPLVLTIQGINRNSYTNLVKIESQSVNSILLDTTPNDNHERQVQYNIITYSYYLQHNLITNY